MTIYCFIPTVSHHSKPRASTSHHHICRTSPSPLPPPSSSPPPWAAPSTPLTTLLDALLSIPPLFSFLTHLAKSKIISTAESHSLPWSSLLHESTLNLPSLIAVKSNLENPSITYPEYYLQPFHAYPTGNLNWDAALEAPLATSVVAWRTYKDESLTVTDALDKLRFSMNDCLRQSLIYDFNRHPDEIQTVLDLGCSVGISIEYYSKLFTNAKAIIGVDLSAYFLSVAYDDLIVKKKYENVRLIHCNGENMDDIEDESVDLVSMAFVVHELTDVACRSVVEEVFKKLGNNGVLVITDNDPEGRVIRGLNPILFTLMKSTEPHSNEYYSLDIESMLKQVGFTKVVKRSLEGDERHRSIIAIKTKDA